MSEPTITYLGPACEADTGDCRMSAQTPEVVAVINEEGKHFKETVVEHRPGIDRLPVGTELVDRAHVTRLQAERDALQLRLNAADQRIDELERDKARLDALEANCWDVRYDSSPNGDAGDSSISIEIIGHWMDKPTERVIGEDYSENLRAAIDQAMTAPAYPPARPEYPDPEFSKDDDWHMNPCKQGHRDVGAAGGVAACNQCDEKIEASTTQEAFRLWNATHPVPQA